MLPLSLAQVASQAVIPASLLTTAMTEPLVVAACQESVLSILSEGSRTAAATPTTPLDIVTQATYASLPLFSGANRLQRVGETAFAATFFVALLQATVAFFSYQTNPVGELVVPPGPTFGVELPDAITTIKARRQKREKLLPSYSELIESQRPDDSDFAVETEDISTSESTGQSQYSRVFNRLNRLLPLLLPWLARNVSFVLARNTHLFHIGFVGVLIQLFDFPARLFTPSTELVKVGSPPPPRKNLAGLSKVCVIGDSLVVGLGTVNVFDKNKNSTLAKCRIERLDLSENEGGDSESPEFPRVFAQTLASLRQAPVSWRSAGVDGGTIQDINEFCFGVIQEEAAKGAPPDVVVIVCGINDLKQFVKNPWGEFSAAGFRGSLTQMITEIRKISPGCKVIIPAMPTQMFHKNSPLNIFPLGFFLDSIVGVFESQKKLVADTFPSNDVMYFGLKLADVEGWYQDQSISLIAADGIHPNKLCYARWAEAAATSLYSTLLPAS